MSNDKPDYNSIAKRIFELRKKSKMTQEDFADATGISSRMISFMETGRRNAGIESLYNIAKNLKVSLDFLVFGAR